MPESLKLRRLREVLAKLQSGKFKPRELQESRVADVDGRMVRLSDDDAAVVLQRRIDAQEAEDAA